MTLNYRQQETIKAASQMLSTVELWKCHSDDLKAAFPEVFERRKTQRRQPRDAFWLTQVGGRRRGEVNTYDPECLLPHRVKTGRRAKDFTIRAGARL